MTNNNKCLTKPLYRHKEVYDFVDQYHQGTDDYNHRYMSGKQKGLIWEWFCVVDDMIWRCNNSSEFIILRNLYSDEEKTLINLLVCLIMISPGRLFISIDDNGEAAFKTEQVKYNILQEVFNYILDNNETVYDYKSIMV